MKLADSIDKSSNYISDLECGKSWPSSETLAALANALEVEPEAFFFSFKTQSEVCLKCINKMEKEFLKISHKLKAQIIQE